MPEEESETDLQKRTNKNESADADEGYRLCGPE